MQDPKPDVNALAKKLAAIVMRDVCKWSKQGVTSAMSLVNLCVFLNETLAPLSLAKSKG